MSRQLTIHLSAQARQAIRPGDGVSPRINQIIERYQALMAGNPLARFNVEHRLALRLAKPPAATPTHELQSAWAAALAARDAEMAAFVRSLPALDVLRAAEALEAEAPP